MNEHWQAKIQSNLNISAWEYNDVIPKNTNRIKVPMMNWWDAKNDFAGLMSYVSKEKASLLMSYSFDLFSSAFDTKFIEML